MEANSYFWGRVNVRGWEECWEWSLSVQSYGYGQISKRMADKLGISTLAHRTAYLLTRGELPLHFQVLHSCDHRICCNPMHLFLGTAQDNMDDKVNKGRCPHGSHHYHSKLDSETVRKLKDEPLLLRSILMETGVSKKALTDVLKGRTWKHI